MSHVNPEDKARPAPVTEDQKVPHASSVLSLDSQVNFYCSSYKVSV